MQYFLGLHEFRQGPLFDSSMMVHFRKRFPVEDVARINEYVCTGKWPEDGRNVDRNDESEEDDHDDSGKPSGGTKSLKGKKNPNTSKKKQRRKKNRGELIMDATVAPSDIKYPTDIDLLNQCRTHYETAIDIIEIVHRLFSAEKLDILREETNDNSLLSDPEFLLRWAYGISVLASPLGITHVESERLSSDWDSLVIDSIFYFQECYADFMMILLLQLNAKEYLNLFEEQSSNALTENLIRDAQRIAIVLAACTLFREKRRDAIDAEIKAIDSYMPNNVNNLLGELNKSSMPLVFIEIIKTYYNSLVYVTQPIKEEVRPYLLALHPSYVLRYVVDYLGESEKAFKNNFIKKDEMLTKLSELQARFDYVFRQGNFLSKVYFETIRNHHNQVRNEVCKKEAISNNMQ